MSDSILHVNIRSLAKNFEYFASHVESMDRKPKIIVLTETWLGFFDSAHSYTLPDYQLPILKNRVERGGGIAVYSMLDVKCKVLSQDDVFCFEQLCLECWIGNFAFNLIAFYNKPQTSKLSFINDLQIILDKFSNRKTIGIADSNLDILTSTNNCDEYIAMLQSNGFQSQIADATRITEYSSTCIDHCFTNFEGCHGFVNFDPIADHLPISLVLPNITNPPRCFIEFRNWKLLEDTNFTNLLNMSIFSDLCNLDLDKIDSASVGFEALIDIIRINIDRYLPKVHLSKGTKNTPWFDRQIRNALSKKKKLYNLWLQDKENDAKHQRYKNFRNRVTDLIRKKEKELL